MTSAAEICVRLFQSVDMPLGPGLTADQLDQVEADFGFRFDDDHRELRTRDATRRWLARLASDSASAGSGDARMAD